MDKRRSLDRRYCCHWLRLAIGHKRDIILDLSFEEELLIPNSSSPKDSAPPLPNAWNPREEPREEPAEEPTEESAEGLTEDEFSPPSPPSFQNTVRRMPTALPPRDTSTDDDESSEETVQDLERTLGLEPPQRHAPQGGADPAYQQSSLQQGNGEVKAMRHGTQQQSTEEAGRSLHTFFPSIRAGEDMPRQTMNERIEEWRTGVEQASSSHAPGAPPTCSLDGLPRWNYAQESPRSNASDSHLHQNCGCARGPTSGRIRGFGQRYPPHFIISHDKFGHGRTLHQNHGSARGSTRGRIRGFGQRYPPPFVTAPNDVGYDYTRSLDRVD